MIHTFYSLNTISGLKLKLNLIQKVLSMYYIYRINQLKSSSQGFNPISLLHYYRKKII